MFYNKKFFLFLFYLIDNNLVQKPKIFFNFNINFSDDENDEKSINKNNKKIFNFFGPKLKTEDSLINIIKEKKISIFNRLLEINDTNDKKKEFKKMFYDGYFYDESFFSIKEKECILNIRNNEIPIIIEYLNKLENLKKCENCKQERSSLSLYLSLCLFFSKSVNTNRLLFLECQNILLKSIESIADENEEPRCLNKIIY